MVAGVVVSQSVLLRFLLLQAAVLQIVVVGFVTLQAVVVLVVNTIKSTPSAAADPDVTQARLRRPP